MGANTRSIKLMKLYPFCKLSGPANLLVMPAIHSEAYLQKCFKNWWWQPCWSYLVGLKSIQIAPLGANVSDIDLAFAAFKN